MGRLETFVHATDPADPLTLIGHVPDAFDPFVFAFPDWSTVTAPVKPLTLVTPPLEAVAALPDMLMLYVPLKRPEGSVPEARSPAEPYAATAASPRLLRAVAALDKSERLFALSATADPSMPSTASALGAFPSLPEKSIHSFQTALGVT